MYGKQRMKILTYSTMIWPTKNNYYKNEFKSGSMSKNQIDLCKYELLQYHYANFRGHDILNFELDLKIKFRRLKDENYLSE